MRRFPSSARKDSNYTFDDEDDELDARSPPSMPTLIGVQEPGLPLPVMQSAFAGKGQRRSKKSARIDGGGAGLKVHWAKLKKRIGTGTAPSSSELEDSTYTAGSSIIRPSRSGHQQDAFDDEKGGELDEVVVDRSWFDEIKSSIVSQSELEQARDRETKESNGLSGPNGTNTTDHDSLGMNTEGFWALNTVFVMLRYRMWPAMLDFFTLQFFDKKSEDHYRKETWFMSKSLALWSAVFLVLNWVLTTATLPKPLVPADRIFWYAVQPVVTLPLFPMIMWDFPRDRPILYQIFACCSVWSCTYFNLFSIYFCGFYTEPSPMHPNAHGPHAIFTCGSKDFLATFIFVIALPTIGIFGLKLKRFPQFIGTIAFFVVGCVLILRYKATWYRNLIQSLAYHLFLLYVHYMRENAERRMYILRDQLKIQYRATQKAQINERKASESKRRLTSYVFHEVRVPLNTALLATQNMAADGVFAKSQDIEFRALEGSLSMMSKVLNDVLDFNRMDSGKFESVSKPYAFHQVMRSLFVPLRLATDARKLQFEVELDETIDLVARRAAYQAMGESREGIIRRLEEQKEEAGMVVGDEMRLRQIINNLSSNACKFTAPGGKITITTKLIWPTRLPADYHTPSASSPSDEPSEGAVVPEKPPIARRPSSTRRASTDVEKFLLATDAASSEDSDTKVLHDVLSANHLDQHNLRHSKPVAIEKIVVRIEVTDTGCGIQSHDMVRNKLFSAFNQTEQGRQQGGKGTGLGLALVRQIVKRSGGRLGVKSKVGPESGSTFWVELPLGVGTKAIVGGAGRLQRLQNPEISRGGIDTGLADLDSSSPRRSSSGRIKANPALALPASAFHGIMDQGGRMVSLPAKIEESNPGLARMTISEPMPSPQLSPLEHTSDTFVPADLPIAEETPRRQEKPSMIQLPITSPASIMAGMRHATDPPHKGGAPSNSAANGPPSAPLPKPTTPAPAATPWAGMPVLVVDDDSLTRMLMKRMLSRLGCRVSTAENGEIALELITGGAARPTPLSEDVPPTPLRTSPPPPSEDGAPPPSLPHGSEEQRFAVVFLDNQMPVCSGLEVVAKLRQAGRTDFVVGVTGNALLSDQEEYLEAGADYILTKPVLEKSLKGMLTLAGQRQRARMGDPAPTEPDSKLS